MEKIRMSMDNIGLKQKIAILIIICVFVPLITTNSFIFWNMKKRSDSEQQKTLENSINAIVYEFQNAVAEQTSIADYLCRDARLKNFLGTSYQSESDYYSAYIGLQRADVIQYYYTGQSAYGITVCTDNRTITNGSYFVKSDTVGDADWYQAFKNSSQQVMLYSFYEDGKKSGGYIEKGRHLVWIRKIEGNTNDFVMMDFNYDRLLKKIQMESGSADCYICTDDTILFSTTEKNSQKKQMKNWSDSFLKECKKETELESYGKKFFFVLTEDHHGLSEVLNSQRYGLLLLYIMNLLLPCVVLYLFYHSLHDRIALTQHCMDQVKEGTYEVIHCEEGSDEVGSMIYSYNLMIMRIRELIEVVYKNKEKQQNLELSKK